MADTQTKDPVLVVVQLSGGNDYLNTIIPYGNGLYQDYRPNIGIPQEDVIPIDDELGFNPNLAPSEGEVLGHRQDGPRPRRRLRGMQPLPLPLDGRVAHRRAGQDGH